MKDYVGFVKSFIEKNGDMTEDDFLKNGYAVSELSLYVDLKSSFTVEQITEKLIRGYQNDGSDTGKQIFKLVTEYKERGFKNE